MSIYEAQKTWEAMSELNVAYEKAKLEVVS